MVFFFVNLLNLASQKQNYLNPFILADNFEVDSIGKILLSSPEAGYVSSPKKISLYVELLTKDKESAYVTNPKDIKINLIKNKQLIPLPSLFYLEKTFYRSELAIPPLVNPGWYDLQVEFKGQKNITATKKEALFFLEEKFNLIFLIDNSGSMRANDPEKKRFAAIDSIVKNPEFKKKIDSISVIAFSNRARVIVPPTKLNDLANNWATSWVKKIREGGDTNFAAGILAVDDLLPPNPKARNIIIFLSDGSTTYPYQDEHKNLLEKNAVVFTIGFQSKKLNFDNKLLKKIAEETGGIYQDANLSLVEAIYKKVINKTLAGSGSLQLLPIKDTYYQNELVNFNYHSLFNSIQYQVKVDQVINKNIIVWNKNSFSLLPLLRGEHNLDITFFNGKEKVFRFFKKILIQDKRSSLETSSPFLLEFDKNKFEQIITFPVWAKESFSFIEPIILTSAGLKTFSPLQTNPDTFYFLETPFSLLANTEKRINLEIAEPTGLGEENFSLFLKTAKGIYAYEMNFIPKPEKKILVTENLGENNYLTSYFKVLVGLSLGFFLTLAITIIIFFINKKSLKKLD